MNANTLPTEIHRSHHQAGEARQDLRNVVDQRICDIRPVPVKGFARLSFSRSGAIEIRVADIGETKLSMEEIDHAVTYGISATVQEVV